MQKQLKKLTVVAHPDPEKVLCVFSDASDKYFSGVITQIPKGDLDLPVAEQHHQPLAFSSGAFKGAELRWGTPEKEGYALVQTVLTFDYLLLRNESFRIFTDHRNLVYIYNPLWVDQTLARHTVHKLQRWALKLSVFNYVIEHIVGEDNVWADLLSRWGSSGGGKLVPASNVLGALFQAPFQVADSPPELPSLQDILIEQKKAMKGHKDAAPAAQGPNGLHVFDDGAIWISQNATNLQLRICVAAHCGSAGHRGIKATLAKIEPKVRWDSLKADVDTFMKSCLLCKVSASGDSVPTPMSERLHSD
jgi:RNase H-like domain found in reverse transcriptase/Integrase zinc binding domain